MSNRDVLMITARPAFAESLFARFDGPRVQCLPDGAVTAAQWRDTALVLVDAAAAPDLIARGFPGREGVIVVSDDVDGQAAWRNAYALGAGSVIVLPDGWASLRAAVRDIGRGAAVIAVVSVDDAGAGVCVATAIALESCSLGQSCIVLDHRGGTGSVDAHVAEVEGEVVGEPGGRLRVASPGGPPITEFQLTGGVRASRVEHDLVVINTGLPDEPLVPTALRLADVAVVVGTSGREDAQSIAERCRSSVGEVRLLELPSDPDQRTSPADGSFRAICWAALTIPVPSAPTA